MTSRDIEIQVASYFDYRTNLIVPNVSWGIPNLGHEADMVILRPSGYATEVEIKVDAYDIQADLRKRHSHWCSLIRLVYFAVPKHLRNDSNIPNYAGILSIEHEKLYRYVSGKEIVENNPNSFSVVKIREAKVNKEALKWLPEQRLKLALLGCMRIWSLKTHLSNARKNHSKES